MRHRYFASGRQRTIQDQQSKQNATLALTDASILDDPFMLWREYTLRSERERGDLFGHKFASNAFSLGVDEQWQGPLRSAYGWHLVQDLNRQPAQSSIRRLRATASSYLCRYEQQLSSLTANGYMAIQAFGRGHVHAFHPRIGHMPPCR